MKAAETASASPPVSAVLLAAGSSSRLGERIPKQLLRFGGEPLVRRVASQLLRARLLEVIVVTGFCRQGVERALAGFAVRLVHNPDYASGQSTSVRSGLSVVAPAARGACFVPCDQPFVDAATIDRMVETYIRDGGRILVPTFRRRRGAPVLFDRFFFSDLEQMQGDEGGRQVLRQYPEEVCEIELEDEKPLLDLDSKTDLARLESLL